MASCTKCGANLVSMARFCARCGSPVVARSSVPPTTDMPVEAMPRPDVAPTAGQPAAGLPQPSAARPEPSGARPPSGLPRADPFARTVLKDAGDPVISEAQAAAVSPMAASIMSSVEAQRASAEAHHGSSPPMYGRASSLPTPSPGFPAPQPTQQSRQPAAAPRIPAGAPPGYIATPWNVAPVPPSPSAPPPPPGPTQFAPPLPMASHSFVPGTMVLVYWADGNRYHGTVVQVSPHHVFVVFPNGAQQWIDARYVTSGA